MTPTAEAVVASLIPAKCQITIPATTAHLSIIVALKAKEKAMAAPVVETTNTLQVPSKLVLEPMLPSKQQKTATTGAAPTTAVATAIPTTDKSMATTATAGEALATIPETTPTATTTADRAAAATTEPPSTTTPATTAERTERAEEEASTARY